MAVALDRLALRRGITTYLAIAAPAGLLAGLFDGSTSGGGDAVLVLAALAIFVVAPIVAGVVAGGAQMSPFVHGAVAVAVPGVAFLVIRSMVGVARGDLTAVDVVTFVLYLVIEVGLGMLGGYVAFRRRHRLA
jgi:hypothetical protein